MMRSIFLWASQNRWLREHFTRYRYVQRSVSRFMPGETIDDAVAAARKLRDLGIKTVLTHLGENIADRAEAGKVRDHYLDVLGRIAEARLPAEISIKLTQLGLDIDKEFCYSNLKRIIEPVGSKSTVWIDMEASGYVDATLELYRRARQAYPNVGVCLQSYLYRTVKDLDTLLPLGPAIRLVKGAYKEPANVAFPRKKDVDENYLTLAKRLLGDEARGAGVKTAIATHDLNLIRRIQSLASSRALSKDSFQFQMLYGIKSAEQARLAREGWDCAVLISYGSFWYPWYMRRLAERPANLWFVIRNMLT